MFNDNALLLTLSKTTFCLHHTLHIEKCESVKLEQKIRSKSIKDKVSHF